jgi:hypothetical protein
MSFLEDTQVIQVTQSTQRIVVHSRSSVSVINAGPIGPPGVMGPQGPPGVDAQTNVETAINSHINSPTPHPVYDDIPDLTILLENGLL